MIGFVETYINTNVLLLHSVHKHHPNSYQSPIPIVQILHCARDNQRQCDEYSQPIGALYIQSQAFIFQGTALLGACALSVVFLSRPAGDTVSVADPDFPTFDHNATARAMADRITFGDQIGLLPTIPTLHEGFQISTLWGISGDGLPTWPERVQASFGYEVNNMIGTHMMVRLL